MFRVVPIKNCKFSCRGPHLKKLFNFSSKLNAPPLVNSFALKGLQTPILKMEGFKIENFLFRRPFSSSKFEREKQFEALDSLIKSAEELQKILTQMNYKDPDLKEDSKKWFPILKEKKLLSKENIQSRFKNWSSTSPVEQENLANVIGISAAVLDSLVNWAIPPSSPTTKEDIKKIVDLLSSNFPLRNDRFTKAKEVCDQQLPEVIERKECIESFYSLLNSRLRRGATRPSNAILASYGAPGTGKSTFINYLCTFPELEKAPEIVKDRLKKSVPITISFNHLSVLQELDPLKINFLNEFCKRILWSYFFDCTYHEFEVKLEQINFRSIEAIFDFILEDITRKTAKDSIFLCVDELVKLGNDNAKNLLSEIGAQLDFYKEKFNFFVTTLDYVIVSTLYGARTGSNRPISFISLPRLPYHGSLKLATKKLNITALSISQERLIAYCCGHPRLLETAVNLLLGHKAESFSNLYKLFLKETSGGLKNKIPANDISIRLAILANPIRLDKKIDNDLTVSDYIEKSLFLNSNLNGESIVPYTSIFALQSGGISKYYYKAMSFMLDISEEFVQTGKGYELFHIYWEITWRLFEPTKLPKYFDSLGLKLFSLKESDHKEPCNERILVQSRSLFKDFQGNLVDNDKKTLEANDYFKYIFSFGPTNPGFDFMIVEKLEEKENLLITLELKFSHLESGTPISAKEVFKKIKLTKKDIDPYLQPNGSSQLHKLGIKKKNFYQVFLLYRNLEDKFFPDLAESLYKSNNLPPNLPHNSTPETIKSNLAKKFNIIIVTREELETLYGPTLSFLGQFWSEHHKLPPQIAKGEGLDNNDKVSKFVKNKNKKNQNKKNKEKK